MNDTLNFMFDFATVYAITLSCKLIKEWTECGNRIGSERSNEFYRIVEHKIVY